MNRITRALDTDGAMIAIVLLMIALATAPILAAQWTLARSQPVAVTADPFCPDGPILGDDC